MSFVYPLGLLALIGIPVIIIIYILRNKYNEQTVTSTYIWKLSDKFLKRRNPLSGLTGLISLILQILTVAVIAFLIARPIFVLPDAAHHYCFVLDSSGSMQMQNGKETRFDVAKEEIIDVIKSSKDGSAYTLISVSNEAVTEFQEIKKKKTAIELVKEIEVQDVASNYSTLLSATQNVFDNDSSALIYLVTDKTYAEYKNVEVIEVGGEGQENYAVFNPTYSHAGGKLKVKVDAISYASDADLSLVLSVDGTETATETIKANKGITVSVEFSCSLTRFESFEVRVTNADDYALDNNVVTYNLKSDKTYDTLIVSETGFFWEAVIDAVLDVDVTVVTPKQYETLTDVYGLYIFDSYAPRTLPDSAVWLINADSSIEDVGFGVRGRIELNSAGLITKSESTATDVQKLLQGVDGVGINISKYVKYSGMYLPFRTLFSYESNPLIFAGLNGLGNRQVVFAFDLHESDFALTSDFVQLAKNLLAYSFPDVIDTTHFTVGDEALINILANTEYAKMIAPSGKEIFIDSETATANVLLNEVGTYVIKMSIAGEENNFKIHASANANESTPTVRETTAFALEGEKGNEKIDGEFDATTVLFVLLAILFVADWGVYCYERYQLR